MKLVPTTQDAVALDANPLLKFPPSVQGLDS